MTWEMSLRTWWQERERYIELLYNGRAVQRITENNYKDILGDSELAYFWGPYVHTFEKSKLAVTDMVFLLFSSKLHPKNFLPLDVVWMSLRLRPFFLSLSYDVGWRRPLTLCYVICLESRTAQLMGAPRGRVSHTSLTSIFPASRTWNLKSSLFQGQSVGKCYERGDVLMEPGDLEILGIPRDEILTRELVTARSNSISLAPFIHVLISISDWVYWHSFKRLAKETHPDRPNGDKEQFQKLQMAFKRALKTIEVTLW